MLNTEIPFDLPIHSKLTQAKSIDKEQIKSNKRIFQKPDLVLKMAETKMNKIRHCAGVLRVSIQLKCNFIFTI